MVGHIRYQNTAHQKKDKIDKIFRTFLTHTSLIAAFQILSDRFRTEI